jgi:hypothetical protein
VRGLGRSFGTLTRLHDYGDGVEAIAPAAPEYLDVVAVTAEGHWPTTPRYYTDCCNCLPGRPHAIVRWIRH